MNLYDKRDNFPFSIVRMPHLDSNIPTKMFYSSYGAEILRIARVTSCKNNFNEHCKILLNRSIKQGGKIAAMKRTLSKIFGRHFDVFQKFYSTSLEFCTSVLP